MGRHFLFQSRTCQLLISVTTKKRGEGGGILWRILKRWKIGLVWKDKRLKLFETLKLFTFPLHLQQEFNSGLQVKSSEILLLLWQRNLRKELNLEWSILYYSYMLEFSQFCWQCPALMQLCPWPVKKTKISGSGWIGPKQSHFIFALSKLVSKENKFDSPSK